ncbi:MAG: glycosyl hydrolase [Xylanivirga thermophila]|uniref:glycosyl hydrolase n=1 Tax=Xylanivirga thermophila TaxID=2496273 RepID=UPI0039F49BE8
MDIKSFKAPSALYRPAPFWSWNDKLDKEELKRQIDEMSKGGWGGYFMHSRVGLVTKYLSDEWMDMIRTCAQKARETGTYAWLYDEDKWPSGFAGGEVSKNLEYRSRALVLLTQDKITEDDSVLTTYTKDGITYYICKRISPTGNPWFNGFCYVDLMNPKAVRAFLESTHERYKESCGEYFGKEIPGIFTDEPCYLMENHYDVPVLPWSEYLPDFFKALKGYSIEDYLKELFFDIDDYQRIRYDFFDSATRLFIESFTKQYYKWCKENDLLMTGHFMAEDNMPYQLQWIGAAMPHYEYMDWPGIDKLGRNLEQLVTVKQVTSVADQLEKDRTFCEVFGCMGQHASFYHRKWIVDWQAVLGINFVNHHLSLYSMRGERKRDYPANLFYQQPWWKEEKGFADYIGRLSYALSEGKRCVDILVIHPIGSVWSQYSPLHKQNDLAIEAGVYDRPFTNLSKELIANKLDFHYGDEMLIEKYGEVKDGKLSIGAHEYSAIVIPPCFTLRGSTLSLIEEFIAQSSPENVVMIQPFVQRIDGKSRDIHWPEGTVRCQTVSQAITCLDNMYKDRIKIIDDMTGKNAKAIICHRRTDKDGSWIFFANTEENREIASTINIDMGRLPVILDIMSGKVYKSPAKLLNGRVEMKVKFYPGGSLLLYFPKETMDVGECPAFLDSGVEFETHYSNVKKMDEWVAKLNGPNVLPINDVTLYMDGELILKDMPISKAWHQIFYKAEEGTQFKAIYKFNVTNIPQGEIFAAIEVAENLDRISLNGNKINALKKKGELGAFDNDKSWLDINFTKVPITGLVKEGENEIIIEGRKINNITGPGTHVSVEDYKTHMPTEIETVYIVGDFVVTDEDNIKFYIDGKKTIPDVYDLTRSGYPFYAGEAEFITGFSYDNKNDNKDDNKLYLKVQDVRSAFISLYVNGEFCGTKYWAPYVFDITQFIREGKNLISIKAGNTLFNAMGPNRMDGILNEEYVGPYTFIDFDRYTEKYTLVPFGIGHGSLIISD